MSLSKKNLGKLKTFIKENNFDDNNLLTNEDDINETIKEHTLLKKSEDKLHNINPIKTNYPNNLSFEDELYDEFNYLLDE